MIRLALAGALIVAGASLATQGSAKPCGNPPGTPGVVTTTDNHHGQFTTEDDPAWMTECAR